jgi:hypothetical protein
MATVIDHFQPPSKSLEETGRPLPSKREVVMMCYTVEQFAWDTSNHDRFKFGEKMNGYSCKNCCNYTRVQRSRDGYTNQYNHLLSKNCIGDEATLSTHNWKCKEDFDQNQRIQAEMEGTEDPNRKRTHQQTLPNSSFAYNKEVQAIFNWIRLIVFFNLSFCVIALKIQCLGKFSGTLLSSEHVHCH